MKSSLKVLHVCESVIGGTGTYLNEVLSFQLQEMGAENVRLLMPKQHEDHIDDRNRNPASMSFYERPKRLSGILPLAIAYVRLLKSYQPDVVHAHSTFAGIVVRLIPRRKPVRIVYCPHGWAFDMQKHWAFVACVRWVEFLLAYLCSSIVAISEYEKKRALSIGISQKKISVIFNGIKETPPDVQASQWKDHRLKVLYVGRLDFQKGFDILIDAIRPLEATVSLQVYGEAVVQNPSKTVTPLPHVEYCGWQTGSVIAAAMMSADIIVIPSRWEGFGLVAIEAMRLKKTVIASSVGGLTELVISGETGWLFPKGDFQELRSRLLSASTETLDAMGEAGYEHFVKKYTARTMNTKILELYDVITP